MSDLVSDLFISHLLRTPFQQVLASIRAKATISPTCMVLVKYLFLKLYFVYLFFSIVFFSSFFITSLSGELRMAHAGTRERIARESGSDGG